VKLTEAGSASILSKEDERSVMLARRAQLGDYDEGKDMVIVPAAKSQSRDTC
jgi:hypothetical protein